MRCSRCRDAAVLELRRYRAAYCGTCLVAHCERQVERAIAEHGMLARGERIGVAVSGGKDSLALWDLLARGGWETVGIHLQLGIGDYSRHSAALTRTFAAERDLELVEVDLTEEVGAAVPALVEGGQRSPCGACGLSKRYLLNKVAREEGLTVLATGHNLDDEAAVLLGNVLTWSTGDLGRQAPVLPHTSGFARRVKPLVRLSERETAAYCVVRAIDYVVEECPMAAGNRHLAHKAALDALEARSPGTKATFYQGYLRQALPVFHPIAKRDLVLATCEDCGSPTTGTRCAFCRMTERTRRRASEPTPSVTPRARRPSRLRSSPAAEAR